MLKIIFLFIAFFFANSSSTHSQENTQDLRPSPTGGDFMIPTTENKNFKLSSLKGKSVFLYFGFTRCPDVCPLVTQRLKRLSNYLKENKMNDARFLFVSVDNERDTLSRLKEYIKPFGPLFLAGTSDNAKLVEIMSLYGARFSIIKNSSQRVLVDHTSDVFIIAPDGTLIESIKYDSPFEDYLAAYKRSKTADTKKITRINELRRKRQLTHLGKNKNCDLGNQPCLFLLPDKSEIKVTLSPYPVKTEKIINISVTTSSSNLTPVSVDFKGIEQNMGYIRPELKKINSHSYVTKLELPICELNEMQWILSVLLHDKQKKINIVEFQLTTRD
jgi:protein SCO1/2